MKNDFRPKEIDLHRIWELGWMPKTFKDIEGNDVHVLKKGVRNLFEGPDFLNGQIRVNGVLWCGNIEFHIKTSDYLVHKHQEDENYNNVILHLVWEHDISLNQINYPPSFTSVVKDLIPESFLRFKKDKVLLPCKNDLKELFKTHWIWFKDRLLTERWERKINQIRPLHQEYKINEKLILYFIGKYYLSSKDQDSWEYYLSHLDVNFLMKYHQNLKKIQIYLFMNANINERYWKDSYEAFFIHKADHFKTFNFKWTQNARKSAQIHRCLSYIAALFNQFGSLQKALSQFQANHWKYMKHPLIGKEKWEILCLNAFIPLSLIYNSNEEAFESWQLHLKKMQFENNFITRKYKDYWFTPRTCEDSQAIIQLYQYYCIQKKCLSCNFGIACLKSKV